MKYLHGIINITVLSVDADSPKEAVKALMKLGNKPVEHLTKEEKEKNRLNFHYEWVESPALNPVQARKHTVEALLKLLQELPMEELSIIHPPFGSIVQTEATKHDDHETNSKRNP